MAFPPNYNQERRGREAAKQRKTREKQLKREEISAQRKRGQESYSSPAPVTEPKKEI